MYNSLTKFKLVETEQRFFVIYNLVKTDSKQLTHHRPANQLQLVKYSLSADRCAIGYHSL